MARSTATIDLDAIAHNVEQFRSIVAPATVCAVVKADGYGHGAVPVARAALDAGATMLAVARVEEARALRASGIDGALLVLTEPAPDEVDLGVRLGVDLMVYRPETIGAIASAARATGRPAVRVHLKIDTGMHRVGCTVDAAPRLARSIADHAELVLAGTATHFAVADDADHPANQEQISRFDEALVAIRAAGVDPGTVHACNSAAALSLGGARHDMVRVGIGLYGLCPIPPPLPIELRPALRWTSTVAHVKTLSAGDSVSYGLRHRFTADVTVATVPVGYADGYRRQLGLLGATVLIGGRRCPVRGVVTMDQFVVECGPDVAVGDEVVLIGAEGGDEVTAEELARLLETINYEIVCAIGARVERVHRSTRPAAAGSERADG